MKTLPDITLERSTGRKLISVDGKVMDADVLIDILTRQSNRARAQIGNFRRCIEDCQSTIRLAEDAIDGVERAVESQHAPKAN